MKVLDWTESAEKMSCVPAAKQKHCDMTILPSSTIFPCAFPFILVVLYLYRFPFVSIALHDE